MSKFYIMTADSDVTDYAIPNSSLYEEPCGDMTLSDAVREGKAQFIDPSPLTVGLEDSGGLEFPDLFLYKGVPLLSDKFSDLLKKLDAFDTLPFRKSIVLKDDMLGYIEKYTLIIPPRVNNTQEAGRYKIFSLTDNPLLIVAEDIKEAARNAALENVYFEELED